MKLITAIAALALLAGSMDVEAQKRGKANNPPGGGKTPGTHQKAPEGAETGHPHISPVAHLAIGVFGELDPEERKDLAEAAGEGDEEALEELRAEHVEAIESMIEALEDEDARQMIGLGIMLAQSLYIDDVPGKSYNPCKGASLIDLKEDFMQSGGNPSEYDRSTNNRTEDTRKNLDEQLDMVHEQLEAQLNNVADRGNDY